jgi:glycosyltransferase involved in cell wall biosynthesis
MTTGPDRLVVVQALAPALFGGLETVTTTLATGLRARGHEVIVAATVDHAGTHPFVERLQSAGVQVESIGRASRAYYREWADLRRLIARVKPSVVHTHGYRADLMAGMAAGASRTPRLATAHGFTGGDTKNRLYEWLQGRALRRFEAVVAVSQTMVEWLRRHGVRPERIQLLRNAWRPGPVLARGAAREDLGIPVEAQVIGWVGRLSHEKGPDVFLDAMTLLPDLGVQACVVGEGALRAGLEAEAARRGLAARVHWLGAVPNAAAHLSAFDALVLSSRTEGTPMVLLEAMAAGIPIVATRVGGVPDVVTSEHAWLVPAETPERLAAAIRECLTDRSLASRRTAAARKHLESDYAVEPWLDQHEALYRRLVASSNAGSK